MRTVSGILPEKAGQTIEIVPADRYGQPTGASGVSVTVDGAGVFAVDLEPTGRDARYAVAGMVPVVMFGVDEGEDATEVSPSAHGESHRRIDVYLDAPTDQAAANAARVIDCIAAGEAIPALEPERVLCRESELYGGAEDPNMCQIDEAIGAM